MDNGAVLWLITTVHRLRIIELRYDWRPKSYQWQLSLSNSEISSSPNQEHTRKCGSYDTMFRSVTISVSYQNDSHKKIFPIASALFTNSLPKSSCKLVAPTVEALSWEPSRCVLPFLASREVLALSTVTWDEVLDGWLFTWEVEGWEAWLRASWRLLGGEGRRGGYEKWWSLGELELILLMFNIKAERDVTWVDLQ